MAGAVRGARAVAFPEAAGGEDGREGEAGGREPIGEGEDVFPTEGAVPGEVVGGAVVEDEAPALEAGGVFEEELGEGGAGGGGIPLVVPRAGGDAAGVAEGSMSWLFTGEEEGSAVGRDLGREAPAAGKWFEVESRPLVGVDVAPEPGGGGGEAEEEGEGGGGGSEAAAAHSGMITVGGRRGV